MAQALVVEECCHIVSFKFSGKMPCYKGLGTTAEGQSEKTARPVEDGTVAQQ